MITLVATLNGLAYFRILSGPAWKENSAVLAKSNMGTRLRLHNIWEHCTCTHRENRRSDARRSPFSSMFTHYLISTTRKQLSHRAKKRARASRETTFLTPSRSQKTSIIIASVFPFPISAMQIRYNIVAAAVKTSHVHFHPDPRYLCHRVQNWIVNDDVNILNSETSVHGNFFYGNDDIAIFALSRTHARKSACRRTEM